MDVQYQESKRIGFLAPTLGNSQLPESPDPTSSLASVSTLTHTHMPTHRHTRIGIILETKIELFIFK